MKVCEFGISVSSHQDIGAREVNEDALAIDISDSAAIFLVADGLGGYKNGEIASRIAISVLQNQLSNEPNLDVKKIEEAISKANCEVYQNNGNGLGMKSTIAALWCGKKKAIVASVGDTRVYQFRNSEICFQTKDHSMSQLAAMLGEISSDDIRGHKDRNRLFRALGANENVKIDTEEIEVLPGDAFLLCSDGFWELINEEEMLRALKNTKSSTEWLEKMKEIVANRYSDETDNNTAITIKVNDLSKK